MTFLPKADDMDIVHFIILFLCIVSLPITALISCILYLPVFLISCLFTSYGKFTTCMDAWLDEEYVQNIPGSSLVTTMVLQGDLSLKELRNHFNDNVLKARASLNPKKLRYPELKQYLTTLLCFRIWKNDPNFLVENHIKEYNLDTVQFDETTLENIHQIYINKPYEKLRSPWEMVLIRNSESNLKTKFILVFRVHHVMADAKSVLKLLVECLGNKKLKTANCEVFEDESSLNKFKFVLEFPIYYLIELAKFWIIIYQNYRHPWKVSSLERDAEQNLKMVVAFSPKIEMVDIKKVALKNKVKTSAVVMSIVAGAVHKFCGDKWNKDVAIGYPLPKPNHPELLTNHVYIGYFSLPTEQCLRLKRLELCNQRFMKMKSDKTAIYINGGVMLGGSPIHPISRIVTSTPLPIGLTNNAGEEEGFSVGNAECTDLRLSVGTSNNGTGLVFCTMSYKDGMRIAVIAKESIIKKDIAENIAKHLSLELKLLEEESQK